MKPVTQIVTLCVLAAVAAGLCTSLPDSFLPGTHYFAAFTICAICCAAGYITKTLAQSRDPIDYEPDDDD